MPGRRLHWLITDVLARLVPAARRDWAEAVWAEAHEVPAGWTRLAWRAGGLGMMAKEGQMVRRTGILVLFAVAAGAAARGAWAGSPVSHGAAVQGGIIITLTLLAGLPLLTRWVLGPPDSRTARWLRAGFYAAIVAIMPAKAAAEWFVGAVPRGGIDRHTFDLFQGGHAVPGNVSGGPDWGGEIAILFITACYLAVILALTARRASVAPATLAAGTGAGLALGIAMYAVVALAWILLIGAPFAAGVLAGRRCHVSGDPGQAVAARVWQGVAAGVLSGGVGALVATVLGTGTTALMLNSAWVRGWIYHGQHLTASAVYGRELYASQDVQFYIVLGVVFPIIGLIVGLAGSGYADVVGPLSDNDGPGGPPDHGGPEPVPAPPDGGRQADVKELALLGSA